MTSLRDLLQRYRPVGTPGAAARAGVPADRAAELAAELEPVFALLAETEEQAERVREEARAEAARVRERAARRAESFVAEASSRAAAVRVRASARARAAAGPGADQIVVAARENAERTRARAAARMPEHVHRAVTAALDQLNPAQLGEVVP